jgi:hypothetical protein
MAKKRNGGGRRRSNGIEIPLLVVAGMAPAAVKIWEHRGEGVSGAVREAGRILTGFDFWSGQFTAGNLRFGMMPLLAGVLGHWLVGKKLGVNNLLRRSGIPFIRL